jgi:group I intron endonuclease
MKIIGIYKITSPSGKIYIGQSIDFLGRKQHYKYMNSIGNIILNSIKKYGWENHIHDVIEECSIEQLNERETYWKQYYLDQFKGNWKKVLFCSLHDQGGGPKSEEFKNNLKKIWSLKTNEEKEIINQKRREGNKGKKKPNAGYKNHSEQSRQKRSEITKGVPKEKNKKPVMMLDKHTKEILKIFPSVNEASQYIGVAQGTLSGALTGSSKTSGSFIWKYQNS